MSEQATAARPRFQDGNHSYEVVCAALEQNSHPNVDYYVLILLSSIICTFGLLLNNAAIVIGAMLIAPLMMPILGIALAALSTRLSLLREAGITLVSGVLLSVFVSMLIGIVFISLGTTDEVLSRTHPSILDLFVALATGFLGGYAIVRKHLSGAIFGVAISISLVPPLSVVGIGLAHADPRIFAGAGLLFATNLVSIVLSGALAFLLLEIDYFRRNLKSLLVPLIALLILAIPLTLSFLAFRQARVLEISLVHYLKAGTATFRNLDIETLDVDVYAKPVNVEVVVRATEQPITPRQVQMVEAYLHQQTGVPVSLTVFLSPVIRITGVEESEESDNGLLRFLPPLQGLLETIQPQTAPVEDVLPPPTELQETTSPPENPEEANDAAINAPSGMSDLSGTSDLKSKKTMETPASDN